MDSLRPRLLVTGGSGFIGINLIEKLLEENTFEFLNLDQKSPKIEAHAKYWRSCDICDASRLKSEVAEFNPDYVIHLAARTDIRGAELEDYRSNTNGVTNLIQALEYAPHVKRVLFTSSMYVCEPGYIPKSEEDYSPHTAYGKSKVETERIIRRANLPYSWSILRPTSIWGPWFGEPYDGFFKLVMRRMYFHLGPKACKKTYGYVENVICQIMAMLKAENEKLNGKVVYLGDYEPYDISEWAEEIAALDGFKISRLPYSIFVAAGKIGDVVKRCGLAFPMTSFRLRNMTTDNIHDVSLIQSLVPVLPVTRREGNLRTVNWLKSKSALTNQISGRDSV